MSCGKIAIHPLKRVALNQRPGCFVEAYPSTIYFARMHYCIAYDYDVTSNTLINKYHTRLFTFIIHLFYLFYIASGILLGDGLGRNAATSSNGWNLWLWHWTQVIVFIWTGRLFRGVQFGLFLQKKENTKLISWSSMFAKWVEFSVKQCLSWDISYGTPLTQNPQNTNSKCMHATDGTPWKDYNFDMALATQLINYHIWKYYFANKFSCPPWTRWLLHFACLSWIQLWARKFLVPTQRAERQFTFTYKSMTTFNPITIYRW